MFLFVLVIIKMRVNFLRLNEIFIKLIEKCWINNDVKA